MKIAYACPASLPATQFGGILFLCVDLAKELSKIGHNVTIYTTDLDFANNANTFNKKLPRIEFHDGFKINRTHPWFSFRLFYVNPEMFKHIRKDRPDIIHTIGARSFQSFIAALVSKIYKIPLVLSDQGGLTTHPDLSNSKRIQKLLYKIQNIMIRFIIKQASSIIVANEYEKKIFVQYTKNSKIEIVRNGIGLNALQVNEIDFKKKYGITENFVLFLGRFNKVKGIDTLLEAWFLIKDSLDIKNTKLVIMGADFGFESEMLKMIDELKLKDHIVVIKKPSREDVISGYSSCEFLVLPSRWELSPLTPLEGFAFKKTVISTKTHGIPYTINDGKNAILVEPDNPQQLSIAILNLLKDDKMRIEYGNNGYELVRDICNSQIMARNTLEVYQKILK